MKKRTKDFLRARMIFYPIVFLALFLVFWLDIAGRYGRNAGLFALASIAIMVILFSAFDHARLTRKYGRPHR